MTVSRVVNNSGYISQETRARVEAAVAELGYMPNALATSLRHKRTKTLALILTDITNPFFTTIARGVEDAASEQGFSVIFANTDESEAEQADHLTGLVKRQVDGVLLVPARSTLTPIRFLQHHHVPVVVLDRRVPGAQVDIVRCDSEQGAHDLVQLLLGLGHRTIAALVGPQDVSTALDRVAGYRRALTEAGVRVDEAMIYFGAFTQDDGQRMAQHALARAPRPTALFAANNFIAIGAYRALRNAGLRAPEDIAMVAFDDLPPALVLEPFLTVAAQPAYEMGRRATELLLARLAGEGAVEPEDVVLPTELIVRRSSGLPLGIPTSDAP